MKKNLEKYQETKEIATNKEEKIKKHVKISHRFITVLSIVSILGFIGIVSKSLFDFDLEFYVEALWMFIVGVGLVWEGRINILKDIPHTGLNSRNFTHLITIIIGFIALLAGAFSFPGIRIETPAFIAVKGIISIIAIVIIIVQTWIIE